MEITEFLGYFKEGSFVGQVRSKIKDKVLDEMVNNISRSWNLKDALLISDMLKRREKLGSTGIGYGIAIPHGRTISVPNLLVAYGHSKKGIDFDAIDNNPVHKIFMIIAPPQEQSNVYLPFLGKLVEILKSEDVRDSLDTAKSTEELNDALAGGF
ncbi:MAG: PTS sugar transporter subunit IIA [bacterium]